MIIIAQVQVAIERDEAEKENGGGLSYLESGVQGLSLNPTARAQQQQETDEAAAKTPVAARSTRAKAAPRKPVKRVMLRDK